MSGVGVPGVVVELTEHVRVSDYDRLLEVRSPYRTRGLRIAVDDAGAGYSSFRHILRLAPALIKADIALVRGVDGDPVRQALLAALLSVARTSGAVVVAEGVETQAELDCLSRLGTGCVHGYCSPRPESAPVRTRFPRPQAQPTPTAPADLAAARGRTPAP